MANNRPRGRVKNVTGGGKGVKKRGDGLGTGPVGSGSAGSFGGGSSSGGSSSGGSSLGGSSVGGSGIGGSLGGGKRSTRASGNKSSLITIIVVIIALLGGGGGLTSLLGGGGLSGLLGGGNSGGTQNPIGDLLGGGSSIIGAVSGGWETGNNTSKLNTSVASGARAKRTKILGNSKDEVTIMVYMCGTDLESRAGMGTSDLKEMLGASLNDKVNVIVYTGGCKKWKTSGISNKVNQIYQVTGGKLKVLDDDAGTGAMTDPNTLVSFIQYCEKHFPANRNNLIFWDHGGGSISGYGYDEKYGSGDSMNLAEINQALKKAGVTFDFIGFDACLMATLETALMLTPYADYMIASEETEPGVGWYYTNWLTNLAKNTSMPTIEIGKNIVDDFVDTCARQCRGQQTTLSVVDLAELEKTVPANLTAFSVSASDLIQENEYKTVSDARYSTREFAASSGIDQVDLVHLAHNMGTDEGKKLVDALLSSVKYNRTSSDMTNAYGLSIYFPYKKVSSVDKVVDTYEAIGMDEEYMRCIQQFASLEVGGQTATGGTSSPLPSLLGLLGGGSASSGGSSDAIAGLLGSFLSGQFGGIKGLDRSNTAFFEESGMTTEEMAQYLSSNYFDPSALVWKEGKNGEHILQLSEAQWALVHNLELNVFYDDGEGFIDLGLDNVYEFDDAGNLIGDTDRTWLAINGQPVAYYHLSTVEDGDNYTITGRVPALLNGERVNLILVFDNENPYGYIAGARYDYVEGETETVAKALGALNVGDTLDFLCDYYTYGGEYQDSYYLGEQMTVTEQMTISNVDLGEGDIRVTYLFTDIYNQKHWTEVIVE